MRRPLILAASLAVALPAGAETQRRCGWYQNPSPANVLLTDADGDWWISMQGQGSAPGFDDAYDDAFGAHKEWVFTNGDYGYGCACIDGDFGPVGSEVVRTISRFTPLSLAKCQGDPNLPPP